MPMSTNRMLSSRKRAFFLTIEKYLCWVPVIKTRGMMNYLVAVKSFSQDDGVDRQKKEVVQ